MGIYSEYLDKSFDFPSLCKERKKQLLRITEIREGREIFTFACAMTKQAPIGIDYDDRVPIKDQLSNLKGDKIDIILETPGGLAEIVEDIVKQIRDRFTEVAMIVPGYAKSAGTIMVMSGDEILMEPDSALGPIDAQIFQNGKRFSAHAFLEGLEKIKQEVEDKGSLNRAYVPILHNISPGEIQSCVNALNFSKNLVAEWLSQYKFKFWDKHSSTGYPVTDNEKRTRAAEIANFLCDHSYWLTHERSITIKDLRRMRLIIKDYSEENDLCDAIIRYYTLLKMSFDTTNIYKIYETLESQIYRFATPKIRPEQRRLPEKVIINFECPNCKTITIIQGNFKKGVKTIKGAITFPKDNIFICPSCNARNDLNTLRNQIESEQKNKII